MNRTLFTPYSHSIHTAQMMLLAREKMRVLDQQIRMAGLKYKRILVLQPDVLFDASGKTYIMMG